MFAPRYFPERYYAGRYFPPASGVVEVEDSVRVLIDIIRITDITKITIFIIALFSG